MRGPEAGTGEIYLVSAFIIGETTSIKRGPKGSGYMEEDRTLGLSEPKDNMVKEKETAGKKEASSKR